MNEKVKQIKVKDIRFDEFDRELIMNKFMRCFALLKKFNIHTDGEVDFQLKKLSIEAMTELSEIENISDDLYSDYPKLRFSYEYTLLFDFCQILSKIKGTSELHLVRIKNEMRKLYPKELDISNNIPFSEFRRIYENTLGSMSAKSLSKLEYSELFLDTSLKWLIFKSEFDFSDNEEVALRDFKMMNEKVFDDVSHKIFTRYVRKKFNVLFSEGRSYFKTLVRRGDDLGKQMKLNPDELIVFEASISPIEDKKVLPGSKFQYPENTGAEYLATSRLVSNNVEIKIPLLNEIITVVFPIVITMQKAQIQNATQAFFSTYSKKVS